MTDILTHGLRNFLLSEPAPELSISRKDVDALNESWQSETEDAFVLGAAHPQRPGMIIDSVRTTIEVPGESYVHAITALGDAKGTRPTKILNRSDVRTLDAGWDEFTAEYLTWQARWRTCTAAASSNIVTCAGHGFPAGQRVLFRAITGGGGIVAASSTALGTVYYVIEPTPSTFKVSATLGGSALDITTDMTAGQVIAAEFAKGTPHPDHPNMYLVDLRAADDYTDWRRVTCTYKGMIEAKPFKRIITCNGQTMSTGEPIIWDFPGGWTSALPASVNLPKVVCTDTYLTTDTLATNQIPYSEAEGATPPDPPSIRTLVIFGTIDRLTYHWPNGWSRVDEGHVDSIPGASVHLKRRVSEYVWPVTIK